MKPFKFKEIKVFENYEAKVFEYGHVVATTEVVEDSLNYHRTAHGGYLFTLCDQISGGVCVSTGYDAVTQQANINYMRSGKIGDILTIDAKLIHDGSKTKVTEVIITNQTNELLTKATFTMFVIGKRED